MTDLEKQTFVDQFRRGLGGAGRRCVSRPVASRRAAALSLRKSRDHGREIGKLNDLTKAIAPHLTWKLVDWTSRDDVVVIEWESSNRYGERVIVWRGVDKMTLRDGKIIEEIVYCDTAPLQALRRGMKFDALIQFPD